MDDGFYDDNGYKVVYYISEQDIYDYMISELKIQPTLEEVEGVAHEITTGINHKQIMHDAVLRYIES